MANAGKMFSANFKVLLTKYVEDFIVKVAAGNFDLRPIPIAPAFSLECKGLNIWFKTSFGFGNAAAIPWLACLLPGQGAELQGVYPVLLFDVANSEASVCYGVSASAKESDGVWPRAWPDDLVAQLPKFASKKKRYSQSSVAKNFQGILPPQIGEIVDALLKVLEKFLDMRDALGKQLQFDFFALKRFNECASDAGLQLTEETTTRLVGSALTKRFCILTGLAGSGKTKLAEAFAMWLCASDQQYRIVAVGADWTGNENLLGYADALHAGKYRAPVNGALELMLRAAADPAKPYFLILDEMNLSHVERYFADFLSAMESANSQLALHGEAADIALDSAAGAAGLKVPAKLSLPSNLFIIGTVNVDETTYMFSPKVLDRANVIEFRASAADMGAFLDDPADINLAVLRAQGVAFAPAFVQRAAAGADIATLVDAAGNALGPQLKVDLLEVFGALSNIGAEFGFRTAKEIARFMVIHQELSGTAWIYKDALDAQVLQKLMPKLHGSARKLSGVLKELEAFATTKDLKLTLEKVQRMQQRLERDGFTSFAEA